MGGNIFIEMAGARMELNEYLLLRSRLIERLNEF